MDHLTSTFHKKSIFHKKSNIDDKNIDDKNNDDNNNDNHKDKESESDNSDTKSDDTEDSQSDITTSTFTQLPKNFQPIEEHGMVGNMRTAALISTTGVCNWYCVPYFDSPAVFGALLDTEKGGHFAVRVCAYRKPSKQVENQKHTDTTNNSSSSNNSAHKTTRQYQSDAAPCVLFDVEKYDKQGNPIQMDMQPKRELHDLDTPRHHVCKQHYHPDTNVLVTRFVVKSGVAIVRDYLPVKNDAVGWFVREIEVLRGSVCFEVDCRPAFNYGRDTHVVDLRSYGALFRSDSLNMALTACNERKWLVYKTGAVCNFLLKEGQKEMFVFRTIACQSQNFTVGCGAVIPDESWKPIPMHRLEEELQNTIDFWRHWLNKCTYKGRWREAVYRSALTLKMLTFAPTGAIISSPTTSIPGCDGGIHDYRYTWIKDSSFVLYAFIRLGFVDEARGYVAWIQQRITEVMSDPAGFLRPMYTIHGSSNAPAENLSHWSGYLNCGSIRIGNSASNQLQLDVYGDLLDMLYLSSKYSEPISMHLWADIRSLVEWLCHYWNSADRSIWGLHPTEDTNLVQDRIVGLNLSSPEEENKLALTYMSCVHDSLSETMGAIKRKLRNHRIGNLSSDSKESEYTSHGKIPEILRDSSRQCFGEHAVHPLEHSNFDVKLSKKGPLIFSTGYDSGRNFELQNVNNHKTWLGSCTFGDRKHFTYSRISSWICLDRSIRLAGKRSFPADLVKWVNVRNAIYEDIQENCWSSELNSFVQAHGSRILDVSVLLSSSTFLMPPTDPRFVSTLAAIMSPVREGGLMRIGMLCRFTPSEEQLKNDMFGTHNTATFWGVEACARLGMFDQSWLDKGRLMFENMLSYSNHVGLFSEQIGSQGEACGNFPHALSCLSMISSAFILDRALSGSKAPYLQSPTQ